MEPYILNSLIFSIVSYMLGFATGYFVKSKLENLKTPLNKSTLVLVTVSLIWAISMVIDIVSDQYETSPYVHGLMGAIVGFFYRPIDGKGGKKS